MTENRNLKEQLPPRWADRFLEWYCRPELLDEIQGDAYELFLREVKSHPTLAKFRFCWNVLCFFRWKNIRKTQSLHDSSTFSLAMFKNALIVSLRNFLRRPGHTFLNVAGLAIGFCCVLLITLWVRHEFSFDRFHQNPEQIYKVISHVESDGSFQTFDAASAGIDVATIPEVESLVSVSQGSRWPHTLCFKPELKSDECIYLNGVYASPEFFSLFNFQIVEGDTSPLREASNIAISESMAAKLYGSKNALGKTIKVDGHISVTIASVFEDNPTNSSLTFDFVMPFAVLKKLWGVNDEQLAGQFFPAFIRVSPTANPEVISGKLNTAAVLTLDLKKHHISYEAYPFTDWRLHSKFENGMNSGGRITYMKLFVTIGCLVLFLAIINYVNMATAKATTRAREIGIRKVTGARKSSIVFQFLTESLLLVILAFAIALVLAQLALPFFRALIGEPLEPDWASGQVVVFLTVLLLSVALAAGFYPALVMSSFQPIKILKNQIGSGGSGSDRLRKGLLVLQVTISLIILNFAGVIFSQLDFIHQTNPGFEYANTLHIEPTATLFRDFDVFKNELQKNPAILSIGASNLNPIKSEGHNAAVNWSGKTAETRITFQTIGCSYEFPETIGLTIVEGRGFTAKPVDSVLTEVLVTRDAVRTMKMNDPIGQEIEIFGKKCVIVGVVNDFHTESLHEARLPVILYRIDYMQTAAVYVRYKPGATSEALATVQAAYKSIEPTFTMKYWFQDETFDELYKMENTMSKVILVLTFITLVIATIGVVSLSTFNVLRKTKEISVRRVFGASGLQIMLMLSSEFRTVMLLALVAAVPFSWFTANEWLSGFAYHVALPVWLFGASFLAIAVLSISIICIQGFKTVRGNPSDMLRSE